MDPTNRGPEEYGQNGDQQAPRPRSPRDPLTSDFGQHTPALARTVQLVSGDFLLTVNPVDGSEIEVCPPAERPGTPGRLSEAERTDTARAARPPVPPGPNDSAPALLARDDERERLVRLLARGRSVRLTGPAGSGRSSLLDLVAEDCAGLAPDGVVRLSGFHRTADDLLHDLFYAVHRAPLYRPDREELLDRLREVGAVVVLDDAEFGGAALDELLAATPECAFVLGAGPDVPAPSADSAVEEVLLTGLDRSDGVALLERAAGRTLTEDEANWAGDLWFESEGLPLRFVQAGALLRRRDRLRAGADAVDEFGVFADALPADDTPFDAAESDEVPLPSLGEAAAPAPLLASRLSASARATLEFAVALGGEVPHQAHLPALVGDTHADAALGELADCGLVSPVGSRYRLAAGVLAQLEGAGYADDVRERALAAGRHYAWWAGHPSVTPERVCAEADAVLAALAVLVPATVPPGPDEESPAVRLARAAAPAFAAGLHWSAWERALRSGSEASRLAGDVAEQAYFHHELGVLALCSGQLDRARAELEASIGLRGALSDKRGAVAGRRALALVADRTGDTPGPSGALNAFGAGGAGGGAPLVGAGFGFGPTAGEEVPDARHEESASPSAGVPAPFPPLQPPPQFPTLVSSREDTARPSRKTGTGTGVKSFARRNLVAAGAGALLVAVLGTVVTLGATSENDATDPSEQVGVNPSASQGVDDGGLGADRPSDDGAGQRTTARPTDPGPDGTPGTSDDPAPSSSASTSSRPSDGPSSPGATTGPGDDESPGDTGSPTKPTKSPGTPTAQPTSPEPTKTEPTDPGTPTETEEPTTPAPSDSTTVPPSTPETSDSASGPGSTTPTTAGAPADSPAASQSSAAPDDADPAATGQII